MLGTVSKGLGLADPIVRVSIPAWIFAETLNLGQGMSLLCIYRSLWLHEDDGWYEQVRTLLERSSRCEEIYRRSREDKDMMHGKAEWLLYVLNPVKNLAPIAAQVISLVKEWGEPLHPIDVPASVAGRLRLEGV